MVGAASLFDVEHDEPRVALEELSQPSSMVAPVTFIHTADWQLGMTRHFLRGEPQALYAAARLQAIRELRLLAEETAAEFMLVAGDVFEDNQVSGAVVEQTLDVLREFNIPIYLLPGNHDPLNSASVYRSSLFMHSCPDNVIVLDREGVFEVRPGVQLVAAPWRNKSPLSDLIGDQLAQLKPTNNIRIMVGHGAIDTLAVDSCGPAVISTKAINTALTHGTIDYVALGDRHSTTSIGETGRIWYSGAHEVTNFERVETNSGNTLVVTLTSDRSETPTVETHRVGSWRFLSITEDISSAADITALAQRLEQITQKHCTVIQLGLSSALTLGESQLLDDVLARARDRFAAVTTWEGKHRLSVIPEMADFAELNLRGFMKTAAQELIAATDDENNTDSVAALRLLYRLTARADGSNVSNNRLLKI